MWETQGPGAFREEERLATSDHGIVMLREALRANIEKVMEGIDPSGIIRDPNHEPIDTTMGKTRISVLAEEEKTLPVAPRELVIPKGRL